MSTTLIVPSEVRTAFVTALGTVSGIGRVHAYRRIARDDQAVKALYMDNTPRINVWMLSLAPNNPIVNDRKMGFHAIGQAGGGTVMTTLTLQIEAYYGVADADDSDEAFQNLLWTVVSTINGTGKLTGFDAVVTQGPLQVAQCTYAMLLNKFLTHYARLTIALEGRSQ